MITKQTLKNTVIKSNKISKMLDNLEHLEQTKISIENNIKMLTLAERENKRLLARNKYSELEKCKGNNETRMEALQDLRYKVQEIMTEKSEEASDIDAYAEQLKGRISQFDTVILSLERAIQLLADSEEAKSRRREGQEQEVEFRRKLEQEKQPEEMRMEMRKQFVMKEGKKKEMQKQSCQNWLFLSLSVRSWIGSGSGTNSRLRLISRIT